MIPLKVKKLHEDAVIPVYAKPGDAGFDLVAVEDIYIPAQGKGKVPIGLAFEIPEGYELQIRPRSGVTSKTWIRVQLGTVDSGYRGEVQVMVDNLSYGTMYIPKGHRIAQGVVNELPNVHIIEVEELGTSDRGEGGFGSTGFKTIVDKVTGEVEYIRVSKEGKI